MKLFSLQHVPQKWLAFIVSLGFVFAGCEIAEKPIIPSTVEKVRQKGVLKVLTQNTSTTYYEARDGLAGFEHDLVVAFAEYLGVEAQFKLFDSVSEVLQALREGKGDLAAAGLTRTPQREKEFLFGSDYYQVQQQLVCRRGNPIPQTLEDLPNFQIDIIKDSSYEERLKELKKEVPDLQWNLWAESSTETLLGKVSENELECVVADSNIVAVNRRYFPELVVAFPLTEEQPLAWVLLPGATTLKGAITQWFEQYKASRQLAVLKDRYYSHLTLFDYVDIRTFYRRMDTRLPDLIPIFQEASQNYDISWLLLAAQAYQESHWDRKAKSPTGVRGIMMLTLRTAEQLGVVSRLNVRESIMGGAKYFSQLLKRVPENVQGDDRLWFALAAYNVGMGHMYDARALARRFGKNPNKWIDLQTVLPLLSQPKYYNTLKHGYARGAEPVIYVQRIREFYDILLANADDLEN